MRAVVIAIALLAAALAPARALSLQPMTLTLDPSGQGSVGTFRIKNDGRERSAVQVRLLARSFDAQGSELDSPAGESFILFPSRLVLEPGASGSIKVKWNGEQKLAGELAFRLVVEQVPVEEAGAARSGIRVLFRYVASLYVAPKQAKPELRASSAFGAMGPSGERGIVVEIENAGSRHVVPISLILSARPLGSEAPESALGGPGLAEIEGVNFLPGLAKSAFFALADAVPGEAYEARIQFDPEE